MLAPSAPREPGLVGVAAGGEGVGEVAAGQVRAPRAALGRGVQPLQIGARGCRLRAAMRSVTSAMTEMQVMIGSPQA